MDHILSDLSTMTHPSWVAPRAWLSFTELDKAVGAEMRGVTQSRAERALEGLEELSHIEGQEGRR